MRFEFFESNAQGGRGVLSFFHTIILYSSFTKRKSVVVVVTKLWSNIHWQFKGWGHIHHERRMFDGPGRSTRSCSDRTPQDLQMRWSSWHEYTQAPMVSSIDYILLLCLASHAIAWLSHATSNRWNSRFIGLMNGECQSVVAVREEIRLPHKSHQPF